MDASKAITKAKVDLAIGEPFFSTILFNLRFQDDPTCQTAWTDGKSIGYNAMCIQKFNNHELIFVLCHEVMHIVLLHHLRRCGRDHRRWNVACDYAINGILIDSGFKPPHGVLIDSSYKGLSAEEIYSRLPSQPGGRDEAGQSIGDEADPGGTGEVRDYPGDDGKPGSPADMAKAEQEIRQSVAQAVQAAKRAGKIPGSLKRLIDPILHPKLDPMDLIRRFITDICKDSLSWSHPNRRLVSQGLYLPGPHGITPRPIVIGVDTSGSIDDHALSAFITEISAIASAAKTRIDVVYFDTLVQGIDTIEPGEQVELHPKGGGGTDYRPFFDHVTAVDTRIGGVLVYTDGECSRFPMSAPECPVLWVCTGERFQPPFGEVIKY